MRADTVFHGDALKGSLWSLSERRTVTRDFFLMAKLVFRLAKEPLLCKLSYYNGLNLCVFLCLSRAC